MLLKKVRTKKKAINISFRCDSPDKRRLMKLDIEPTSKGIIEFRSTIIRTEHRDPVILLQNDIERSEQYLTNCSLCKKIATPEGQWLEVEDAIVSMKLFEKSKLPYLLHGVCSACYAVVKAEAERLK